MMNVINLVAGFFGFSTLKLGIYAAVILAGLALVTGVSIKLYSAGKQSVELANIKAQTETLIAVTKAEAAEAQAEAEQAKKDLAKYKDILDEIPDTDVNCLSPAILDKLQGTVGRETD